MSAQGALYGTRFAFANSSLDRPFVHGYHCSTIVHNGGLIMKDRRTNRSHLRALVRQNVRMAKQSRTGQLERVVVDRLREMTKRFGFSLALGDFIYLDGGWYVTHAGLLRLASRRHCRGIDVQQVLESCDQSAGRWVFRATVYKSSGLKGFVGYGDADPSNVSDIVRGAEMRVAETRAVNRALRKAYGIGLCSVEELGAFSGPPQPSPAPAQSNRSQSSNGSSNGQPRLRDQLCLLIRQYNLDPTLVKAYAADFCGSQTLSGASRDLVESFIAHLATCAKENRDSLVCKLNSYAQPQETRS